MEDTKTLSFKPDMDLDADTFPQTLGMGVDRAKELGHAVIDGRRNGGYHSHPELLAALLEECESYSEAIFVSYAVGNLMGMENGHRFR